MIPECPSALSRRRNFRRRDTHEMVKMTGNDLRSLGTSKQAFLLGLLAYPRSKLRSNLDCPHKLCEHAVSLPPRGNTSTPRSGMDCQVRHLQQLEHADQSGQLDLIEGPLFDSEQLCPRCCDNRDWWWAENSTSYSGQTIQLLQARLPSPGPQECWDQPEVPLALARESHLGPLFHWQLLGLRPAFQAQHETLALPSRSMQEMMWPLVQLSAWVYPLMAVSTRAVV